MKYCFYFALILFISCNNEDKKQSKYDSALTQISLAANFKTLDTTLFFAGYWVNEAYVNAIKISKSPKVTEVPERSCITIPSRTLQQTVFVYGFHEGGEQIVFVKNGNDYEIWNAELNEKRDKVEILAENRIKIGKDIFVSISYIDSKKQMHNPDILAAILFKGIYLNMDGTKVELNDDGTLKGLSGFDKYSPIIDYADEGMQVDQIMLHNLKGNEENFGFQFKKDTLFLYKIKCLQQDTALGICAEAAFGDVAFKLIKKS